MTAVAQQQHHWQHDTHSSQSVMEDDSDTSSQQTDEDLLQQADESLDMSFDPDSERFYQQQHQQAIYYQQHQAQYGTVNGQQLRMQSPSGQRKAESKNGDDEDDEAYSDDDSSTASIPDENIDFSLTYALHTFLATVEGQASVVKGDSLLLLDDANSYWWLVRVLKTEDVGYIPAENIETPYERLARLNKHRNVDLAAATTQEKSLGESQNRSPLKMALGGLGKSKPKDSSGGESRRVGFAPPTYVEHPGVTWSEDEDEEGEAGDEAEEVEGQHLTDNNEQRDAHYEDEADTVDDSLHMEPDDGVEWADEAGRDAQKRQMGGPQPGTNNPFAQRQASPQAYSPSKGGAGVRDTVQVSDGTRRITATPAVAQVGGPLLPSVIVSHEKDHRSVSGQSVTSMSSVASESSQRSDASGDGKAGKARKGSQAGVDGGEGKKKKGVLSGLFSRNKKEKRGGAGEPRNSEESIAPDPYADSPASIGRASDDSGSTVNGAVRSPPQNQRGHGLRVQQQDQALQQAYQNKYLARSPSSDLHSPSQAEAAAAVAQSAAAMRLAATMAGGSGRGRPSSIILSPNPAGPPLLNVIRIFAGEYTNSESSFKTVLVNENTTSDDLIRQAMQRFGLPGVERSGAEHAFYLTIRDVQGEETELGPNEKPLLVFQDVVRQYTDEDESKTLDDFAPKINRLSVGSITSVMSLSNHPAIQKLGMNDFEDDSAVKIYFNRRRPGSAQVPDSQNGQVGMNSQWSSYSTGLSTVQESSPERRRQDWETSTAGSPGGESDATATPPHAQQKYNQSLHIQPATGSPDRFSSPSARFTIQLAIRPADLPDNLAFDPASEAIVSRSLLRDRAGNGHSPAAAQSRESRLKFFVVPRNVTVVEAIEQGLDRFGIQEGVVDGGDAIEGRGGGKVRYGLVAIVDGEERHLPGSMKMIDAYTVPPNYRSVERMTVQQRRRSRDYSQNVGSREDVLPSDPVFALKRVDFRKLPVINIDGPPPRSSSYPSPATHMGMAERSVATQSANTQTADQLSPAAIIAAQRAASRANQKALISAHANQTQGLDVVVPNKGTFRSSRLLDADREIVRYSYIDSQGETYDISELLEEEWGAEGTEASPALSTVPSLTRTMTDSSAYVTAPSTPLEEPSRPPLERKTSHDILEGVVQRSKGQEARLGERLERVIDKVKTRSIRSSSAASTAAANSAPAPQDRATPSPSSQLTSLGGRTTPQHSQLSTMPEDDVAEATPRAERVAQTSVPSGTHRTSQTDYASTANSVNRIISRHRQQPSIASIISDISTQHNTTTEGNHVGASRDSTSTPATATSSTHPTPPSYSGQIFTRALNVTSPTPAPQQPVRYTDDFGLTVLMACIEARALDEKARQPKRQPKIVDDVEKKYWGDRIDVVGEGVPQDIADIWRNIESRFSKWDEEIDGVLEGLVNQYAARGARV